MFLCFSDGSITKKELERLIKVQTSKHTELLKRSDFTHLKVHKTKNFFGSDFEFCFISLLVMLKYLGFVKKHFLDQATIGEIQFFRVV